MKKVLCCQMFCKKEKQLCEFINKYNIQKEDIQAIVVDSTRFTTVYFWGEENKCYFI